MGGCLGLILMLWLRCQPAQNSLQHPAEATLAPTLEVKDMFRLLTRNKSRPLREAQRAAFVYISIYRIKRRLCLLPQT